jgi:hypothetical protein
MLLTGTDQPAWSETQPKAGYAALTLLRVVIGHANKVNTTELGGSTLSCCTKKSLRFIHTAIKRNARDRSDISSAACRAHDVPCRRV